MKYYKQLDSLRAISIILVIIQHWYPETLVSKFFLPGMIGVNTFFVISGFLISDILIANRLIAEKRGIKKSKVLFSFYIRRFLRIFPIYYLTLFFLLYINLFHIRDTQWWYISYTMNWNMYLTNSWMLFGHIWSLCVEEQFYLIWPLIMLFIPLKHLKKTILIILIISPVGRMITFLITKNDFVFALPISSFDGFCIGAILAYLYNFKIKEVESSVFKRRIRILSFISLFCLITILYFHYNNYFSTNIAAYYFQVILFMSLLGYCIVYYITQEVKGFLGYLLQTRLLLFIGKISYSLYLFHNILEHVIGRFGFGEILPFKGYYRLIYMLILVFISTLSWYLFEKPINGLKKHYPYIKQKG